MEIGKSNYVECDDESLIKIEYYEDNEEDPLKEDRTDRIENINGERDAVISQDSDVNSDPTDSNCILDSNTEFNQLRHTWYKEIDKTGKFVCYFCTNCYLNEQTLRRHVLIKHPIEAEDLKSIISKNRRNRKNKCHVCKKYFTGLLDLRAHMKSHSIDNSQSFCHVCQASFDNHSQLSTHCIKHNIALTRIFTCHTCGYQTRKSSHLNQHLNTHSDIKNACHKCRFCNYSTNYLPNLKVHERIHTNVKPYLCKKADCDYRSRSRTGLRSHMLKHNLENTLFYCDKCMYKTVYKQSLLKHNESHVRNTAKVVL